MISEELPMLTMSPSASITQCVHFVRHLAGMMEIMFMVRVDMVYGVATPCSGLVETS